MKQSLKIILYLKKIWALFFLMLEAIYIIFRYGMYKNSFHSNNTRHIQYFCQRLCQVLKIDVVVHGASPQNTALWASNHISFLDIPVLGSTGRISFLSKEEIAHWPFIGFLARSAGTLFIKRGSGDTHHVSQQMAHYLQQDIPIVFFPEATTTNGEKVKKIHGKLFKAAIDAKKPLQIALICYINSSNQLDSNIPFVDISFVQHAKNIFNIDYQVKAHVKFLPQIDTTGQDIYSLTAIAQEQMSTALAELQKSVLYENFTFTINQI